MNKSLASKVSIFIISAVLALSFLLGKSFTNTFAIAVEKIDWCHCEPNGGCQTLSLPLSALLNAGHVDAGGNPLHEGDHEGQCTEEPVDLCTNIEGQQETIPEDYYHTEAGECFPKTPVCADDSYANYGGEDGVFDRETETIDNELCSDEPPVTPTPTPNPDVCANIDGVQTGVPEGLHLDAGGVNCVSFSDPGVPPPPPVTGQVLGATTMAQTGSFLGNLYAAIMAFGAALTAKGLKNFKKASKKA